MTYNMFGGTLNLAQSINHSSTTAIVSCCLLYTVALVYSSR